MESDGEGEEAEAQGLPPAKLGWLWEAEHALFIQAMLFRSRWAPVSAAGQELG